MKYNALYRILIDLSPWSLEAFQFDHHSIQSHLLWFFYTFCNWFCAALLILSWLLFLLQSIQTNTHTHTHTHTHFTHTHTHTSHTLYNTHRHITNTHTHTHTHAHTHTHYKHTHTHYTHTHTHTIFKPHCVSWQYHGRYYKYDFHLLSLVLQEFDAKIHKTNKCINNTHMHTHTHTYKHTHTHTHKHTHTNIHTHTHAHIHPPLLWRLILL